MTMQYLTGELSLLLAQLQAVTVDQATAGDVARLRREAETRPLTELTSITIRALALSDSQCWDALAQGDLTAFTTQATAASDLYEFGICSGILEPP